MSEDNMSWPRGTRDGGSCVRFRGEWKQILTTLVIVYTYSNKDYHILTIKKWRLQGRFSSLRRDCSQWQDTSISQQHDPFNKYSLSISCLSKPSLFIYNSLQLTNSCSASSYKWQIKPNLFLTNIIGLRTNYTSLKLHNPMQAWRFLNQHRH